MLLGLFCVTIGCSLLLTVMFYKVNVVSSLHIQCKTIYIKLVCVRFLYPLGVSMPPQDKSGSLAGR